MSDLISRQSAIDAVEKAKTARSEDGEIFCAKINAQMNIQLLPSAQPERKGKWIRYYAYYVNCSECGYLMNTLEQGYFNFCPNCGAYMRGEANEAD